MVVPQGLLQIEDCLDADGGIVLPPGVTLISLIDRNIANVGDAVAYRYLDFTRSAAGQPTELTWTQLGVRLQAIGARVHRSPLAAIGSRSSRHRASTTSQGSSRRSRREPLRCRCLRPNSRAMSSVSKRR